ncbi:UDP-glycosyltransferase 76E4-like [Malus domestica]|uniref:UDP-glycosyltransferase 76E4-like n=1 Tax=Malus domestica TaxID=3750 RepID=UPI0010AA8877|nr:UDP-glycosyltransferase 76E4-like isoform X2 [Malus domestica]
MQTKNNLDSKMEQSKGRRLILCPLPLQGHINPMLELANILHSKGFSVAIIHTNFNSLNPSTRNPHFSYHSTPVDLTETEASIKDLTVVLSILNAKCVEPFRECLAGLLSDGVHSGNPIASLISDPFFDFTRSVAESFELPTIMLKTGGAASLAVYAAFPLLKEKGYLPISGSQPHKLSKTVVLRNSNGAEQSPESDTLPLPFQVHIYPMLELANILHTKGFSITIIHTRFNSLNPSTLNLHFTNHTIPVDLSKTEASTKNFPLLRSTLNAKCVEPFRECLAVLLSDDVTSEEPVACLISDTFFDFTRSVADIFKLPRIMFKDRGCHFLRCLCGISTAQGKGLRTNTRVHPTSVAL